MKNITPNIFSPELHSEYHCNNNHDSSKDYKELNPGQERGQHHIINSALFVNEHLIDVRLSSTRSLFAADGPPGEIGLDSTGGHQESSDMSRNTAKTFSGLINRNGGKGAYMRHFLD